MIKSAASVTLCALLMVAQAAAANPFDEVRGRALAGDYQAQRNLAYGYSTAPYAGQRKDPVAACAWRIVILQSGHPRVDATDRSNFSLYCSLLEDRQQPAALDMAKVLYRQIYRRDLQAEVRPSL